jgi:hypothetical protein
MGEFFGNHEISQTLNAVGQYDKRDEDQAHHCQHRNFKHK